MAFYDRAWMTIASGPNPLVLGSAVAGFRTFAAAGLADQATSSYTIIDGTFWETGQGTYTASGTKFGRRVQANSNGDTTIYPLSTNATIFLDVLASDLNIFASLTATGPQTFASALAAPLITVGATNLSGVLSYTGPSNFPGGLATSGSGNSYTSQGNGLVLYGRGDTYDVFIGNRNGAYAMVVSPGSTSVLFGQNIMVPGTASVGGTSTLRTFNVVGTGSGTGSGTPTLGLQNNSATSDDSHGTAVIATNTANGYNNWLDLIGSTVRFHAGAGNPEVGRFDASGNLLVGVTSGAYHTIFKSVPQGAGQTNILTRFFDGSYIPLQIFGCGGYGYSQTASALWVGYNSNTGRAINAGGTINASGADYAEYMTKADGCATIAKGDVCGVNSDGHLVTQFDLALSFVIKTTDPNLVGGDTWDAHLPERPQEPAPLRSEPGGATDWPEPRLRAQPDPGTRPVAPALPDEPTEEDLAADAAARAAQAKWDADAAAWLVEQKAYDEAVAKRAAHDAACSADRAAWLVEQTAHEAAAAAFAAAMPAWQAEHDAARATVDRVSFCGQVPANLTGDYAAGDYVIPARAADGTIQGVAVAAGSITFDQYRGRIGKIWAVRDGRAWIDVQHG